MSEPRADRRPIAARQLRITRAAAGWLMARGVPADAVSLAGMAAALAAGLAFAAAPRHALLWLAGAVLVQVRLIANLLDGMVVAGCLALGLAAALAAMATAYVRALGKAAGQASDFCGPGAKQHRMAAVTLVAAWCLVAPASLAAPAPRAALWIILALATLTAGRRLWRLARALRR